MPRLSPIDPALATGAVKEIFDGPLKGKHFNIFRSMAASPAALELYLGFGKALSSGTLSLKERETIQLAIGEANNCSYCTAAHTAIGKGAGLTEVQTIEARRGKMSDPRLGALVRFVLAIHEKKGFVSDAEMSAFRNAGYGDGAIAEVVANYALAVYTNVFNHVNDTVSDFPPAPPIQ